MKKIVFLFSVIFVFVTHQIDAAIFSNSQQYLLGINNGLVEGKLELADINNDGYLDLGCSGTDRTNNVRLIIFTNNQAIFGLYQEPLGPKKGLVGGVQFVDINNDSKLDLIVGGVDYISGNFNLISFTNKQSKFGILQYLYGENNQPGSQSILSYDFTRDGDHDLVVSGDVSSCFLDLLTNCNSYFSKSQSLLSVGQGIRDGVVIQADLNNDDTPEIIAIGEDSLNNKRFLVLSNFNNNFYIKSEPAGLSAGYYLGGVMVGDVDSDGYVDLLVHGNDSINSRLVYYKNNSGNLAISQEPLGANKGLSYSSGALVDLNSDGKLDLVVAGNGFGTKTHLFVFTNNNGSFNKAEEPLNVGLVTNGVYLSSISAGDIDNDGDSDLIILGANQSNKQILMTLKNTCTIPNSPPPSPNGLNVENVNGFWKLKWSPVTGDDHTAAIMMRYNVAYGTNPGVYSWGTTNITYPTGQANLGNVADNVGCTFQTRIPDNKKVYWKVCSIDTSFKNSTYSVENAGPSIPSTPSFISSATVSTNRVDLAWHALVNESSFTLFRNTTKTTNGAVKIGFGRDITNGSDTTLAPNTKYFYTLIAYNVSGQSALSAFVSNTTPPRAPSKPIWVSSLATGTTTMDLKWQSFSNVSSYTLFRNSTGSTTLFSGKFGIIGSTNYPDSALTIDTKYYYWLRAYNVTGKSPLSDVITNRTWPNVPSQPTLLKTITTSTDAIRVVWSPMASVSGFTLYRNTSSVTTGITVVGFAGPATTNLIANSLVPGQKYWFFLRAMNITGGSVLSAPVTNRTLVGGVVVPPSFISSTLLPPFSISLYWNDLSNETNYLLYRAMTNSLTNNAVLILSIPRNQTNYTDTGLPLDTTCFYWLKARNMKGASGFSLVASNRTVKGDTNSPSEVSSLVGVANPGTSLSALPSIKVTWMNPTNKDLGGIRIVKKIGSAPTSTNDGTMINVPTTNYGVTLSYDDPSVLKNTTIYYRIYTYDKIGNISVGRNVSVFSGNSIEEKQIIFNQNPVHPDKGETLVLEYSEDASVEVTFDVYTVTGVFIRRLSGAANRVEWDCKNGKGELCARGIYLFVMKVDGKKVFKDAIKVAVER